MVKQLRKLYTALTATILYTTTIVAQENVTSRLIIIGNAGEAVTKNSLFLSAIKNTVPFDSNTIVVYLGNYTVVNDANTALRTEADIVSNTEAKAFFAPGYEDWAKGKEPGYNAILNQQKFLSELNNKNIKLIPEDACAGPEDVELKNDVELVVLNSQWWLHERSIPGLESDCKYRTKDEVLAEVEDIVMDKWDKMIFVLSYHPMKNTGIHSGTFGWKQHIFPLTDVRALRNFYLPLPVVGSLYPITRSAITTNQMMTNITYRGLVEKGISNVPGVKDAFQDNPNTLFIGGQEHNMQLMSEGDIDFIVSGATTGGGRIRQTKATRFASPASGFSVVEVLKDKKVQVKFYEVTGNAAALQHTSQIADFSTPPQLAKDTTTRGMTYDDSTVAIVGRKMARSNLMKRILIGENYRKEWGAPVNMKVFRLEEEKGGLTPKGIGGGHESKSLQMKDPTGREWGLRSINKNLEPVIPEGFHGTLGADIIQDILSGMHPYGSLVVPPIQGALGIPHAVPEVVFVPNDTALKVYRPLFANTVMQLEERKPAINSSELQSTYEVFNEMISTSDHLSDQRTFLKARLVDVLISDFDRHRGQWSWGTIDTAGRKMYYPIPKDRDQALYSNNGLIMTVARLVGYQFMVNFKPRVPALRKATLVGAHIDRNFLNALSADDWKEVLSEFQAKLTDSVFQAAVNRFPREIYDIRGEYIYNTLKVRKERVIQRGMGYYYYLAKKVNVMGGNKAEIFKVSNQDGQTLVQVYTREDNALKYSRIFDPSVTKELRLFGFNGDDRFDIDESVKSKIKLRVIGGLGNDTFDIRGNVRNHVYDWRAEQNNLLSRRRTTKMFRRSPSVNDFRFSEPFYSQFSLPVLLLGANRDDGFLAGLRVRYKTFGFRKLPYGSAQTLSGIISPKNNAYRLNYTGEFINVFRRFDVTTAVETANPTFYNFFGYGNESVFDKSRSNNYYRARYNYTSAELMLRKRFFNDSLMSISAGPAMYYYSYSPEFNERRILEDESVTGLDRSSVRDPKFYAGGKMVFAVRNINNEFLPTQGVEWNTELTMFKAMNDNAQSFSRLYSTMDVYAELSQNRKVMATLHFGGGHIFSNHFEYFQAFTLGGNNYLRGYRTNRFTGSSVAYGSAELKVKLFDFNAYVLKADVGLVGFTDMGRVWMKNEFSQKWHMGYGGGIYMIPFNTMILSVVMGVSEEDQLLNASLGTRINMVFQGRN